MTAETTIAAADRLHEAARSGTPCEPVRDLIGLDLEAAYQVQFHNTRRATDAGRRLVGRKIGLTSRAVQQQLGVDQPDFGVLFADMEYGDGEEVAFDRLLQPKAEAEIAFVLKADVLAPDATPTEVCRAVDYVVPAIEIVGSRVRTWDIRISDTIADNASSGCYVIGGPPRRLEGLDLPALGMVLARNGTAASYGSGAACLGNPLNAVVWLARTCAALGMPLRAGDVVLSGALGPMVPVAPGDRLEARIAGLGAVSVAIGAAALSEKNP
ncbi:2-keto-4-pentenoate hydratase [Segnochrobactrum spirostomi]|uniref:2-keto-4-pentenoate hydratase n=1 Tax=Segnochrobactrum spirostomi TaxID=2608987 RepID=A0A6A7YA95_9HYPH|nr:2-keto-4-pentenoate hydratase [Segnochrobactrum spirostomi]MQT14938.1 2-keto-4-pentenoate hydratase [Segnochrobactrum spirostomi]